MNEQPPTYIGDFLKAVPKKAIDVETIQRAETKPDLQAQIVLSMSTRQAAKVLGVSHSTIARLRQGAGIVRAEGRDGKFRLSRGLPELRAVRDAEIVRLRESGAAVRTIAEAVGCSVGTVHRVIKREAQA